MGIPKDLGKDCHGKGNFVLKASVLHEHFQDGGGVLFCDERNDRSRKLGIAKPAGGHVFPKRIFERGALLDVFLGIFAHDVRLRKMLEASPVEANEALQHRAEALLLAAQIYERIGQRIGFLKGGGEIGAVLEEVSRYAISN